MFLPLGFNIFELDRTATSMSCFIVTTFPVIPKSKERIAKGTLQSMMPEAAEQVPTRREEKACTKHYETLIWVTSN